MSQLMRRHKNGRLGFYDGPRKSPGASRYWRGRCKNAEEVAKQQTRQATKSERILWSVLQRAKTVKFEFQVPVRGYVADFCCYSLRLIVELDGAVHQQRAAHDFTRDKALRHVGFRVLRIRSHRVFSDLHGVIAEIHGAIKAQEEEHRKRHGLPAPKTANPSV